VEDYYPKQLYKSISYPEKNTLQIQSFNQNYHLSFWRQKFKHTGVATLTLSS